MTTNLPDFAALIKAFSPADNYHLMLCRGTWLGAMRAYRHESDERLAHAIHMLAYALGKPEEEVSQQVECVNNALLPFPMPAEATAADNDPIWDMFLRLVLFTQADDDRAADCAQQLAKLTPDGPNARWWKKRAGVYALLGLPVGTRL